MVNDPKTLFPVLDSMIDMVIVHDLEGTIVYANEALCITTGYTREELLNLNIRQLGPEDGDLELVKVFSGKEISCFERTGIRKDGTAFPVEVTARLTVLEGRKLVVSVARDITERVKARETLQQSEAMVRNIMDSVGEGFVIIDSDYRIISANKAYCEQVNLSCGEIIGRHCYEVSHRSDTPCFAAGEACAPRQTFETGAPHTAIHTHYDKEGNPVYIETRSFPMKDATGIFLTVIETLNNITEKRTLERQLRHAQKMEAIGTLAGGIAHDFNNLLSVMIGYAGLLQMSLKADAPQMSQIKEILSAGDRATQLTRGLLTFSRKQTMETRTVDLNEIVLGFKKMLARIIGEDIELEVTLRPRVASATKTGAEEIGALTMKADIVQIEQVLMNLVSNARDAMPRGGSLTIETAPTTMDGEFIRRHSFGKSGRYAVLTVSDTGTGMDAGTREKIFEPFFTTKEEGKGTGLGLSIVYGIVKQHNGYINCYSEPGKGTTFRIYLPLTASPVERTEIAAAALPAGGTETILVAEDDAGVRTLVKDTLAAYGYQVLEAVDGEDAVRVFREKPDAIRLLLFDLIMPKMSGKDACAEIQAIRPDSKVIFTSGYSADIIRRLGIDAGVEFISKPVSPSELLRKVREVLDNRGATAG